MSAQQQEVVTATAAERSLTVQLAERNITNPQWHTLSKSLYPGASATSVLMVIDYCRARNLDPLKKPCHIVPMQIKVGHDYEWRDVILPGIYELRTTAMRTGLYLGHSKPEYGPETEFMGVKAPEYCDLVIYRWSEAAQMKAEFPVRTRFAEVCGTTWDKKVSAHKVNARWSKAPVQMLVKCAEAAGLREAFPDELGGQMTVEEMEGQRHMIDVTPAEEREQETNFGTAKISAVKMRQICEGAIAAASAGDANALWAVWGQLSNAEIELVWKQLRSYERSAIKKLQSMPAYEVAKSGLDVPAWGITAMQAAKTPEAVDKAYAILEEIYSEHDQEVPLDIQTIRQDCKAALGVSQ
jgi:phage recombination protein Bet